MEENLIKDKKLNAIELVVENKNYIYPILLYVAGLFVGVISYRCSNEAMNSVAKELFSIGETTLKQQIINHFCIYFSVYTLTILLGLCLIGFPVLNLIPMILGTETAIKLSYLFVTYSAKGIGYSLLMIIPECSVFVTILILVIVKSRSLSKAIFDLISKKTDMTEEFNLKSYLYVFLLYGVIVAFVSVINSCFNYLLSTIISI